MKSDSAAPFGSGTSPWTGEPCTTAQEPWRHYILDRLLPDPVLSRFFEAAASTRNYAVQAGDANEIQYAGVCDTDLARWFLSIEFVRLVHDLTGAWCTPSEGLIQFRRSDASTPAFPVHVDKGDRRSFVSLFYVSRDWSSMKGGRLLLHDAPDAHAVAKRVDPLPNRLVIFETASDHWHSVEKVRSGERYSIMIEWQPG